MSLPENLISEKSICREIQLIESVRNYVFPALTVWQPSCLAKHFCIF